MRSAYIKVLSWNGSAFATENPSSNADAELWLHGTSTWAGEYVTSSNISNFKVIVDGTNPANSAVLTTRLVFYAPTQSDRTKLSNLRMYISPDSGIADGALIAVKIQSSPLSSVNDAKALLSTASHYFCNNNTASGGAASVLSGSPVRINATDPNTYVQIPFDVTDPNSQATWNVDYVRSHYILFQLQLNQGTAKINTTSVLNNVVLTFLYDEEENI